ncbi:hypothetical protein C8J56DRAFT_957196 [Mycena floridula]|nr:hypothetical protein C8J56DRAFT_957196 [Mycena floridula]
MFRLSTNRCTPQQTGMVFVTCSFLLIVIFAGFFLSLMVPTPSISAMFTASSSPHVAFHYWLFLLVRTSTSRS